MTLKIVTSWETLIMKAKRVGRAELSGDKKELAEAEADLKFYEEMVKKSDHMILPFKHGGFR